MTSNSTDEPGPKAGRVVLDHVDHRLIDELRADSRRSVSELADRVAVSRATAYARLARLRDTGVIRSFTISVDHAAVGLTLAALVLVNVEQHAWRELSARLVELPGVEWLGLATGPFDVVLLVRAADMATLRDVVLFRLQSMPEVRATQTVFLLDELSR